MLRGRGPQFGGQIFIRITLFNFNRGRLIFLITKYAPNDICGRRCKTEIQNTIGIIKWHYQTHIKTNSLFTIGWSVFLFPHYLNYICYRIRYRSRLHFEFVWSDEELVSNFDTVKIHRRVNVFRRRVAVVFWNSSKNIQKVRIKFVERFYIGDSSSLSELFSCHKCFK